jgi:hypothetical protein
VEDEEDDELPLFEETVYASEESRAESVDDAGDAEQFPCPEKISELARRASNSWVMLVALAEEENQFGSASAASEALGSSELKYRASSWFARDRLLLTVAFPDLLRDACDIGNRSDDLLRTVALTPVLFPSPRLAELISVRTPPSFIVFRRGRSEDKVLGLAVFGGDKLACTSVRFELDVAMEALPRCGAVFRRVAPALEGASFEEVPGGLGAVLYMEKTVPRIWTNSLARGPDCSSSAIAAMVRNRV